MRHVVILALTAVLACIPAVPSADVVAVRYVEGVSHGFLALRNPDGTVVANGDFIQRHRGSQISSRLVFRFKDGSVDDDTALFTQRGNFRLVSDHHVQKGPAFKQPFEMTVNVAAGQVVVRYKDDHGQDKTETERMELPADVANGMLITLLKNVRRTALPPSVSYVTATPKPRLVKLEMSLAGLDSFAVAGSSRRAAHYVLKVNIGGVAGVIAPLVGKQPHDAHVWVLEGEAPAFVRAEFPLFFGGPVMRIDLASPSFPSFR